MGKESKLRNRQATASRYNYGNGQRKIYDRDKMPEGLDSDVWALVLLFEQRAEENLVATPGRPVMYSELYHRISKDSDLKQLLPSTDAQYTRTRDTDGIGSTDEHLIDVLTQMIEHYWDYYYNISTNQQQPINDFCSPVVFSYIKKYVVDGIKREQLKKEGTWVVIPDREIKPSRRTTEEKELYKIKNSPRTEEETKEKIEHWKGNRTHTA